MSQRLLCHAAAAAALLAGCDPARKGLDGATDSAPDADSDPGDTGTWDTDTWYDTGTSGPTGTDTTWEPKDTAIDTACAPVDVDTQPEPLEPVVIEPCSGSYYNVQFHDGAIFAAGSGSCSYGAEVGSLSVIDSVTLAVEQELRWEDTSTYAAGSVDGELVVALGTVVEGESFRNYSFVNTESGSHLGAFQDTERMRRVAFADSSVLAGATFVFDNWGAVAWFEEPPIAEVTFWDADVIHSTPGACLDCYFGSIVATVGDVTGDGIEDAVVGGGGLWFVDGDLLGVDGGVQLGAVEVNADAAVPEWLIDNVGDFDGDGLDDYATSTDGGLGSGKLEVMHGGGEAPFARILGYATSFPRISEGVGSLGDLDGDGRSTIVTEGAWWGMGGDEIWLIEGGTCGVSYLDEVGTRLALAEDMSFEGFAAGDGILVIPTIPLEHEDDDSMPLWVYTWD